MYWIIGKGDIIHNFQIHVMSEYVNVNVCVHAEFKYTTSHFIVVLI